MSIRWIGLPLGLLLASCGSEPPLACTTIAVAGLSVAVFDDAGARVCTALVKAKSGDFEETLQVMPSDHDPECRYIGLYERTGTFTVTAMSARFVGVPTQTVTLAKDACHVIPQAIELRP
jgi:hypothetical protein